MQRPFYHQIALSCAVGLSLLLVGCEGGPGFLRGARLKPINDGWFPLSTRHYAIGEWDGIRLKVAGSRHHTSLFFDLFIENASVNEVRLCEECVTLNALSQGTSARVRLAWGEEPNSVGKHVFNHRSFVIPTDSSRLIQGLSNLKSPIPHNIRIDVTLNGTNGQSNKFSFYFEVPMS